VHNYFLIENNYSDSVIYNFKPESQIWKTYNVVQIIILLILISKKVVLKFLSVNNMVIANLLTHIWLVEPKKNQLIFHAQCGLDYFFISS
jgi:uncharacterized membrane protein